MKVHIDGENFEIPDADVVNYVDALRAEEGIEEVELVPPNKYIFGVNVTHTKELAQAGKDIRAFIDTIGDGEVEVQVSVNAKLNEHKDMVVGFDLSNLEPAIGHVEPTEYDYDEEEYDEPYEDSASKRSGKKVAPRRRNS